VIDTAAVQAAASVAAAAAAAHAASSANDAGANKKHNGGSQLSPGEIIRNSGQPAFPQAQHMPAASAVEVMERTGENVHPLPRAQQRSGSSASNASDEDTEDHKSGGRSQSRIDKWKAKHEAMLKMAGSDKSRQDKHSKNNSASSEDEHEAASASANGLKTNGVCQLGLPKSASVPTALSVQ
jgi:hypothetical protein